MKASIGLVALVGMLASTTAVADGNLLLQQCLGTIKAIDGVDTTATFANGVCLGRIDSVRSTMAYYKDELPNYLKMCLPETGISNGQAVRIVVKYLKDHPAELHNEETLLTILAFTTAYPCKK